MKVEAIIPGVILGVRPGGCTTGNATQYVEVMDTLANHATNGVVEIVGRCTHGPSTGYRPLALYGKGTLMTLRPELCEVAAQRSTTCA